MNKTVQMVLYTLGIPTPSGSAHSKPKSADGRRSAPVYSRPTSTKKMSRPSTTRFESQLSFLEYTIFVLFAIINTMACDLKI